MIHPTVNRQTTSNMITTAKSLPSTTMDTIASTVQAYPLASISTTLFIGIISSVLVHKYAKKPTPTDHQQPPKHRPVPIITSAYNLGAAVISKISPAKETPPDKVVHNAPDVMGSHAPGGKPRDFHEDVVEQSKKDAVEKARVAAKQAPGLPAEEEMGDGGVQAREEDGTSKPVERDVFGENGVVEKAEDSPDFVREGEDKSGFGGKLVGRGWGQGSEKEVKNVE
jgi:hypothetical protein